MRAGVREMQLGEGGKHAKAPCAGFQVRNIRSFHPSVSRRRYSDVAGGVQQGFVWRFTFACGNAEYFSIG